MTKRTVTLRIPCDIAYLSLALENAAMVAQMMGATVSGTRSVQPSSSGSASWTKKV